MAAMTVAYPDMFAKDALLAWYRGEFAAANAIIDALCSHLTQIGGVGGGRGSPTPTEYEEVFGAIRRRRMNWFPVLNMQKYFSIAEVAIQLRRVAEKKRTEEEVAAEKSREMDEDVEVNKGITEAVESVKDEILEPAVAVAMVEAEEVKAEEEEVERGAVEEEREESSGESAVQIKVVEGIGRSGGGSGGSSQEEHSSVENVQICSDHEECANRPERIKTCKGFMAKEPVKGHMVNVVKGLKMYEDIFMEEELSRLSEFINELRVAGHSGELAGDTFIFFNKQMKGNKREIIQLGVPIFQPTNEEATSHIEPIPSILQNVIDHLVQWRLIPEGRRPNSCIINFFDEGEYSQPYFKPPHLDNPISTLFLYETTMAFGRVLVSDHDGNYKGSLTLPLKEGSLVVMRGNSADMARHVICPSSNTRVCITFLKVRPPKNQIDSPPAAAAVSPLTGAMTIWKPECPVPQKAVSGAIAYATPGMSPAWGMTLQAPVVMLAPPRPIVMNPTSRKMARTGGTGVFLPWTVGPKKYIKHLPPRIQKRRLHSLSFPPPIEMQVEKAAQIPCLAV